MPEENEPNPSAIQRVVSNDAALNPYAPTSYVSETEGLSSDVDAYRRRYLSHEASVRSIGTLYMIPGVLLILYFVVTVAVVTIALVTDGINGIDEEDVIGVAVMFGIFGGLGSLQLYTGIGLRKLTMTSRNLATIFGVLGLLAIPFGTLINGYILYLLHNQKGKVVFSEEYQDVIRRTPHIRYKTPLILKILLIVLLLVLGVGVVGVFFGG